MYPAGGIILCPVANHFFLRIQSAGGPLAFTGLGKERRRSLGGLSLCAATRRLTFCHQARQDFLVTAPVTNTLGNILYADKSKVRVSEEAWLQLVRRVGAGDQSALYSLYEQTNRIVFTLVVRIVMNRETAEEVTLDVFHEVWKRASSYDPANGSVSGWIMNQARSRAIDRLRFDQRKKRVNTYPHSLGPATDMVDPQQAVLFEEQGRRLRDALEVLTPEERKAIETAFFFELTYEQTATRLNQPLGTVKTRIRSGLGKLREALKGNEGAG